MEKEPLSLAALVKEAERHVVKDLGRSYLTVANYQHIWRKMLKFAVETAHADEMSEELAVKFVEHLGYRLDELPSPRPNMLSTALTSLRILLDIHLNGHVSPGRTVYLGTAKPASRYALPGLRGKSTVIERLESLPDQFRIPLEQYLSRCKDIGFSKSSLMGVSGTVPQFCQFAMGLGVGSPLDLRPPHITQYVLSLSKLAPTSVRSYSTIVRCFLRYLYLQQITEQNLADSVPSSHLAGYGKIPTVWTKDEVAKLLAQVDRGSPKGRRDYAILMLAAQTGMRVGDIIRLKFSNINWEQKRIEIIQSKTQTSLVTPMSEDLGWALIDYIRNGRPKAESDTVFVSLCSPYNPFVMKDNLYHIITKYRRKAGIQKYARQKTGMHTLRHSLASNLLSHDVPLPTISSVLGHSDPESTSAYIKVDIIHLRQCAIDPDEVSCDE